MAWDKALLELLRTVAKQETIKAIYVGTAVNIDGYQCTVQRTGMGDLKDVRLNAIIPAGALNSYITVVPKEGSYVLAGIIENHVTEACVLQCSEVEKVMVVIGDVNFVIDSSGYKISKGGESLKQCLSDLADAINEITVPTQVGPSGTPINAANITAIKGRLNSFLI